MTSHLVRLLILAVTAATTAGACADSPNYGSAADAGTGGSTATGGSAATGGAGGHAGAGGSAGRGVYTAPACDPTASTMGKITAANPLVSVGRPVKVSAGGLTPEKATDGLYTHSGVFFQPPSLPGWVAISVTPGPTRLLLSWSDTGYSNYTTLTGRPPVDYQILTSADSTDGADGTWTKVADVVGNKVRTRAHTFAFTGQSWVKFLINAGTKDSAGAPVVVALDEIALYDISQTPAPERAADSWLFMGDSITAGAFIRNPSQGPAFDELVHKARPAFYPAMLGTGIGSELSGDGLGHVAEWLMLNPDMKHFAIMYGTNDSWGDRTPTNYEANMNAIVDMVLAAGRTPILARLPYSAAAPNTIPLFNDIIDRIATQKGLPCGPDLYAWFRDHPEEIDPKDTASVHPSLVGYASINRLWAEAMLALYPAQ